MHGNTARTFHVFEQPICLQIYLAAEKTQVWEKFPDVLFNPLANSKRHLAELLPL
jgi:hypothetical protein